MKFYPTLQETLARRFDDMDECRDISIHGCQGGVGGFTYTYEINEFVAEFESEIEDKLYDIFGDSYVQDSGMSQCDGFDAMRAFCAWFVVEEFCQRKTELVDAENEAFAAV